LWLCKQKRNGVIY